LYGQQEEKRRGTREEAPFSRQAGPSELERENLGRVAASVPQIAEVLRRDAGLLVELKRWVAKEAADNGQVVEESDLTDQAIFDRLARDVQFRSLATRLLQRYGYLMPSLNPDSDFAKEQELILKERARRLVQIENQENSASLEQEKGERRMERTTGCDARWDTNCTEQPTRGRRSRSQTQSEGLESRPNPTRPSEQMPQQGPPRTIQTGGSPSEFDPNDGLSSQQPDMKATFSPFQRGTGTGPVMFPPSAIDGMPASGNLPPRYPGYPEEKVGVPFDVRTRDFERKSRSPGGERSPGEEEFAPGSMIHRPNPYADIPSLYDMYVQAAVRQRPLDRFGLDVFRNGTREADAIPMDLPVGPDYVVGPGDGLEIDLWGGVSQRLFRTVGREGRLSLPETGPLLVSGRTLGEVQEAVQQALRTQFRDVSADVSLSRLRTVRVYVVGDVAEPGAYDISSLSTPLNALFEAGGVTARGSLRELKHYRGTQLVQEVDAYDLLLHGVRSDLKRLGNGDTLMVPPIGPQVTVDGMVRRPAIYELRGEKSLADVLELAGGILPAAALKHIEVQRLEAHQKRTMLSLNLSPSDNPEAIAKQLSSYEIRGGDEVHIFPIAPYNEDAIYLQGHVLRPGRYSYKQGMKLPDLIASYGDLLPEPAPHYAEIVRLNPPDFHPSVESFDLSAALTNPAAAPKLEPLDTVRIFSRYDFEPPPAAWVGGEVRAPGHYRTSGQAHLRDAIYLAGGTTPDASLDSAQLFRTQPNGTMKILSVNLREALAGNPVDNILLQPRDRILVHRSPAKVDPPTVYVKGEVAKPGRYLLAANMRVSDLIRSAGGLLRSADPEGGDLTHYIVSSAASGEPAPVGHQSVNLTAALAGSSDQDLPLQGGDVLTIPQIAGWNDIGALVTLRGEVRKPGVYGIRPGERLSSLIKRAGGLLPTAYPRAAVFERNEVRELQQKSRQELIQRLEQESALVKTSVTTTGAEEAALQQAALQQRQRALEGLRNAPVSGRLVIHLRADRKGFEGSPDDIELRAGDSLTIPKQPGAVIVVGQVYNSNAITYMPGRNAGWYLSHAGGATRLADKRAIFIIRADGSVTSGKQGGLWSGGALSSAVGPGDMIVVPERPILGSNTWKNVLAIAQIAQAGALAAAVAIP
jgi:polysaccharide export outer membrane protein